MKIQILSDLHLEFHADDGIQWIQDLDKKAVDVVILAGDISTVFKGRLAKALRAFCHLYPHVIFVAGNHEYYHVSVEEAQQSFDALDQELSNLHILHNSSVYIEHQRFVGSTLWFEDKKDEAHDILKWSLNDFHKIKNFDPWVYQQNQASIEFLQQEVHAHDIVVTHHIPDMRGVHPKWTSSVEGFGRFFLHQLDEALVTRPKYWVHGHGHDSRRSQLNGSELIANPFGYLNHEENPHFDPYLVIEV